MRAKLPILFFLCLVSTAIACPVAVRNICTCQNDQEGVVLQCVGQPLEKLVQSLLVNQAQLGLIKQLTIQQSPAVANLTAKFFDGLYIKKLIVQGSGLERIDAHAFDGLANTLQELNLAHNKIKEFPADTLNKLSSLLSLDLSNNSITDLTSKHVLPTLPKLFEINLGTNKIGDVHKNFFDGVKNNIQSINLGHNELKSVPASALRGFRQLMALHLHNNKIGALDSLSFMNLPVVNLLNLANNRIKSISRQAFINVPSLRYLYLTENKIEEVLPHQFGSFEQLEMLDLSNNRLSNLTTNSFANLPQLKQLYLGSNRIIEIQPNAFANSSVTVLVLEANQLKEITETMFKGMAQLQQLSLKENRINNINQNAFHDTLALVMVDLSHNEIFDLAPATFVSQPNMLLIDMSHNKILRVPYSAFGQNPLVCTEKIHMLQQGVGMLISNNEDIICGAQRTVDKTINEQNNKVIQPVDSANKTVIKAQDFSSDPAVQQPNLKQSGFQPNPVLHNEDLLAAAFRQAEEDDRKFRERGGFVPRGDEHQNEPQLNPTVPPLPNLSNERSNEVLQRPSTTANSMTENRKTAPELTIRPLTTGTNQETAPEKSSFLLTSSGEVSDFEPPPPSILDNRIELTPESTQSNPLTPSLNPTKSSPKSSTTTKSHEQNEPFSVEDLQRVSTSQQTPSTTNVELRGDRSLPTLLIIICLSTVGVVVTAVFIGLCFVNRRSGQQQFFGSSNSSLTARSNSYYGTNTLVHQHPNSQTYISPNQFDAAQMGTMQRTRRNSTTYATPTPINDDVYTWLYTPGPYAPMFRSVALALLLAACVPHALAYCPDFLRNQTACSCVEYIDGAIIRCNGPDGPMMVEKLKKTQTEIGAYAFRNLRIKKLVLDNNRIKTIQKDAFHGLETVLQELSINNNKLSQIPTESLEGLRALNVLSLRCNEIGNLSGYAIQGLPTIIELNLACNKIDKLGKHNLQHLNSLTMLSLSGNNITSIDKDFINNVTNLRYLYLSDNSIKNVSSTILKQFNKVEIFDLSYNNVPDLVTKQFSVMESLQHLNLESNRIKEIAPGAFASTPLILLWLPYNCLTNVSSDIFQGVPFLKQLSLAYNNIINVQPYAFAHLANLHTIDLSHNKISSLQKASLMGTDFLAVRVEENPLVCNQEDGFHVMNGHEAINLTTEVNAICKTDYVSASKHHKCPTRTKTPERAVCCSKHKSSSTTASTTTTPKPEASSTTVAPKMDEKQLVAAMEAAAQKIARNEQAMASAAAAARRLNMDRFMRLSRKPTDVRGFNRQDGHQPSFLERQRELLARAELNEKTKMSSVDANVEFNHDTETESVSKDEQPPKVAAPVVN
ncbi:hypothetical protein M3Y97_00893500 [Aphelenchoides bicaudatus]|nr:hypothetical protein M3Y97_00893500 [Aphelenchoides bicaudatus]